jgi:hypothetical protein
MKIIQALLVAVVACSHPATVQAADLLVPSEYSSIQAAVNAATDGDRIVLAPGTYNEQVSINNKSITIASSGGPSVTKIDRVGNGGTIFYVGNDPGKTVSFEGLTITRWYLYSYMVHSDGTSVSFKNIRCFQGGPALHLRNGADAQVEDSAFVLVGSWDNGDTWGPIRGWDAGTQLVIRRSSFQGTRAYYGSVARTTSGGSITVEDCSFTNCYARYRGGCLLGEGDASVTMRRTVISDCRSSDNEGGGVIFTHSGAIDVSDSDATNVYSYRVGAFVSSETGSVTIARTAVRDSFTYAEGGWDESGGYVHVGNAPLLIQDCTFKNLHTQGCAVWGGVVGSRTGGSAPMVVSGTRFENCSARNACGGRNGRVIYSYYRPLTLTNCTFLGSNPWQGWEAYGSRYGGAVAVDGGSATITGCSFTDQRANERGGAIYAYGPVSATISNCSFVRCLGNNNAVGFDQGADGATWSMSNCTFSGCGVYNWNSRPIALTQCSFAFLPGYDGARVESPSSVPFLDRCLFQNAGWSAASVVVGSSNYALLSSCAFCRPASQEISQYYFEKSPCTFSANCSEDCDADGTSDDFEIASGASTDCNGNDVPDGCEFAQGGTPDCNGNGVFDVCEIADGTVADCDANGTPDSCQPDCDADGVPNVCELASGAADCNINGVPDSCEADCDGDGVINVCEIAGGASDCDLDGVPDACEISVSGSLDLNTDGILDSCQPDMQFAGLQLEIVPIANRGTDDLFPDGAVCYRLYARVSDPSASVMGLYGNASDPLQLSATGGFWQSPFGANFSNLVPCENPKALPSFKYDSWFAVGLECADGNATQQTGMDLGGFNAGGAVNDGDGIVFVLPGSPQSIGGQSRRVLLAQLTTTEAVFPVGRVNVVGRSSLGFGEAHAWRALSQQIPMPALVDCNANGEHDAFDIARGTSLDCDQSGIPDTCEHASAVTDCNGNGISDLCDCYSGYSSDVNTNNVPDECECSGDIDANGRVDADDIVWVLVSWGDGPGSPADVNSDGIVNGGDLSVVLSGWGNCL